MDRVYIVKIKLGEKARKLCYKHKSSRYKNWAINTVWDIINKKEEGN